MSSRKFWTEGLGSFILAILIALTIRWAFMEAYVIPSGSMLPTLLIHDHIFVNKFTYGLRMPFTDSWLYQAAQPERGEVVVFKWPKDPSLFYIKRIVGVPGDKIFYENGYLYINDELVERRVPGLKTDRDWHWLDESSFRNEGPGAQLGYSHWEETLGSHTFSVILRRGRPPVSYGPYTVPQGHYFVMGDNRDNSQDSRLWDEDKRFVPREFMVGRAMFVWLSCERTLPVVSFLCDPRSIRWDRFFKAVH